MKLHRVLIAALLLGALAWGQAPNSTPPDLTAKTLFFPLLTTLPPVTQANLAIVGNPGNGTYYYWLVANYTFGQSPTSQVFPIFNGPNVLTSGNYVTVTPLYPAGALSVDLLKTTSFAPPSGTGNYAVSTGNISGPISDQGGALSSYTVAPANPAGDTICLQNRVFGSGTSHLILGQGTGCAQVTDLSATGGSVSSLTATFPIVATPSPITNTGVLSLTTTCSTNQVLQWNGSAWVCAGAGSGTVTGSGTAGNFAGWATSSSLENVACQFTATAVVCDNAATDISQLSLLPQQGSNTVGNPSWKLNDNTGNSISGIPPGSTSSVHPSGVQIAIPSGSEVSMGVVDGAWQTVPTRCGKAGKRASRVVKIQVCTRCRSRGSCH